MNLAESLPLHVARLREAERVIFVTSKGHFAQGHMTLKMQTDTEWSSRQERIFKCFKNAVPGVRAGQLRAEKAADTGTQVRHREQNEREEGDSVNATAGRERRK